LLALRKSKRVIFDRSMKTIVLTVDPIDPDAKAIAQAAAIFRAGGLVAFATETVYGLGANALDPNAVKRIFAAKGRPATNPLIVHIADKADVRGLVSLWPETADRLASAFWPGPLTLVLPKAERVPEIVTAGGPTVAVRVPAHPVALALLRACGLPLAAPSANRSSRLSPTCAAHVLAGLDGRIDLLLDAGSTTGGLESTVLDLTATPPCQLRPGLIAPGDIEAIIGPIQRSAHVSLGAPMKSPGLSERHYAPRTPLELIADDGEACILRYAASGSRVGWLTYRGRGEGGGANGEGTMTIVLPEDPTGYARGLYAALHKLDAADLERIVVLLPPRTEAWLAVHDRLRRAATP
jgi:L-threonylcarbamoyladenylate synthase